MVAHLDLDRLHFEIRQGRRGQKLALVGFCWTAAAASSRASEASWI